MSKRREFTSEQISEIIEAENKSTKKYETKRIMILRLVAIEKMKSGDIAKVVGYNKATIDNIVSKYFKAGIESILGENRRGGNKRYLSEDEEAKFLESFEKKAENGHIIIVSEIQKAYEKKVGKEVPNSTIYRVLARQNWRKIMPRKRHPKSNPEEQEDYKKNNR